VLSLLAKVMEVVGISFGFLVELVLGVVIGDA